MKKLTLLSVIVLTLFLTIMNTFAENELNQVVDDANLLNNSEKNYLEQELDLLSEKHKFEIVVHTTNSLFRKTPETYTNEFYSHNGYGYGSSNDGIILMISMEDKDWYISTIGFGIEAFNEHQLKDIEDKIVYHLSNGNYYSAFNVFVEMVDDDLNYAYDNILEESSSTTSTSSQITSTSSQTTNASRNTKKGVNIGLSVFCVFLGFVCSLIIVAKDVFVLKSVGSRKTAIKYVNHGDIEYSVSKDIYLFKLDGRN